MKIAFFNIQNLFHRNKELISSSHRITSYIDEMDSLMRKCMKVQGDFERIKELSFLVGFEKSKSEPYATLRKQGGELIFKECRSQIEKRATAKNGWIGWVELQTLPVNLDSIDNKACATAEVNADVLLLQEIEDRYSLGEFNIQYLKKFNMVPYEDMLVLQGNDYRGLEMALLVKKGFKVEKIEAYTGVTNADGNLLFEQNFLQFQIKTPSLNTYWLLAVQFEASGKDKDAAECRRIQQADKVAEIYGKLKEAGHEYIVVAGTLNAVSYCYSISALIQKTDLKDITRHSTFEVETDFGKDANYFRMGAYRKGVNIRQQDYMLFSPKLFERLNSTGLNRRGVWCENNPKWPMYSSITYRTQAASEHPVLWADINI